MLHQVNKANQRQQTTTNLLRILTKRKAQSLTQIKRQWPGKYAPSMTSTIKTKYRNQPIDYRKVTMNNNKAQKDQRDQRDENNIKKSPKKMQRKVHSVKFLRNIPISKLGSISLSIKPSSKSFRTINNASETGHSIRNIGKQLNNKQRVSGIIDRQQNLIKTHKPFRNNNEQQQDNQIKFVNNRLNTALSRHRPNKQSEQQNNNNNNNRNRYQQLQNIQKIKNDIIQNISQSSSSSKNKQQNNNYIVEFLAFNYIDKVIDNPQLWKKFIRKKVDKNNQLFGKNQQ